MSLRESYKKPQVDGGGEFKKPFPLSDGKNVFRLVPPLPQLSPTGSWFKYVAQHFGYKVTNRDGEDKLRTFVCPRQYNSKTKEEKHPCAECHKIERQKDLLQRREVQYKNEGLSESEIATRTQGLRDWLSSHNRDVKYLVHVMNAKGEFGYTKLPSTAFYQLKDLIRDLDQAGIDAFSPDQGVWFSVNKSGKGFSTEYKTTIEMEYELVNGRKMQTEKLAPLSDEQLDQAIRECPNFDKLINVISDRQIEQLAASNGTPEEATAIMGTNSRRESSASPAVSPRVQAAREAAAEEEEYVAPAPSKPIAGSSRDESLTDYKARVTASLGSAVAPKAAAPEVDDEEAALMAKLAALKAKKSGAPAPAPRQAAPVADFRDPSTPAEDFINTFGED